MYEDLKGRLAEGQHGFVKGRSTFFNLLQYSSFVLKSIMSFAADFLKASLSVSMFTFGQNIY
jgi:hypothetical protein